MVRQPGNPGYWIVCRRAEAPGYAHRCGVWTRVLYAPARASLLRLLADDGAFAAYGPYWRADAARLVMDHVGSVEVWQRRSVVYASGGAGVAQ